MAVFTEISIDFQIILTSFMRKLQLYGFQNHCEAVYITTNDTVARNDYPKNLVIIIAGRRWFKGFLSEL